MTSDDFRKSAENVAELRALLENTVLAQAIVCLKDSCPSASVPFNADGLFRAEVLGRIAQHQENVNFLLELAEPLPPPPQQDETPFAYLAEKKDL